MYDVGLRNRLTAKGLIVVEIAGWQTRGNSTYSPRGHLNHHTAGAASGTAPSLNTCIFGRPDLPGPLCQTMQSREPDFNDKIYLIAAGRANHAGAGAWNGLTGNTSVSGHEVEHVGTGPVNLKRLEIAAKVAAAQLEGPTSSHDAGFCCQHFEWAPGRKTDFFSLSPWNADFFRQRVAFWIGRTEAQGADMFDAEELKQIRDQVRSVLDEGTGEGQTSWAGTCRDTLRASQVGLNREEQTRQEVISSRNQILVWLEKNATPAAIAAEVVAELPEGGNLDVATVIAGVEAVFKKLSVSS